MSEKYCTSHNCVRNEPINLIFYVAIEQSKMTDDTMYN